jgi:hypothetical protein
VAHLLNILRRAGADEQAAELPGIGPRTVVWLNEAQLYLAPDFGLYIRYAPLTFRWRQSADALPTLHSSGEAFDVRVNLATSHCAALAAASCAPSWRLSGPGEGCEVQD